MPPSTTPSMRLQRIFRNLTRVFLRSTSLPTQLHPSKTRRRRFSTLSIAILLFLVLFVALALRHRRRYPLPTEVALPPAYDPPPSDQKPLRIILIVPPFVSYSATYNISTLTSLLRSLSEAQYDALPTHLHLLLAPHRISTSFDSLYSKLRTTPWSHGPFSLQNASTGGLFDLAVSSWTPAHHETQQVLILDAAHLTAVSTSFHRYLRSARRAHTYPDVAAFALRPVAIHQHSVLTSDSVNPDAHVYLYQNTPLIPAIAPVNAHVWRTFQRWFYSHRAEWFLWPVVVGARDKKDSSWDAYRGTARAHWTLWFSRFCAEYHLFTVYPATAAASPLPSLLKADLAHPIDRFAYNGHRIQLSEAVPSDKLDHIVQLARESNGTISMTVVNEAFLETARSWICNVDVAGFRPPGVVWITTDDASYNGLKDLPGSYAVRISEFRGGQSHKGTSYGTPGYWLLMLERTQLIGAILERGVGVFAFETDQIWLRDPVPFVNRLVHSGDEVDVVGTLDTRHEIGGNFLFLNPTLATRRTWREVCRRFERAYRSSRIDSHTSRYKRYMENDQSTLTKLIFFDNEFKAKNPTVFRALDTELFVDGRWYDKTGKYYSSEKSRSPILVNNNFLVGIGNKKQRAIEHDHWFLTENKCNVERVKKAVRENESRGGVKFEDDRTDSDVRSSRIEGTDVEAGLDVALAAIAKENQR